MREKLWNLLNYATFKYSYLSQYHAFLSKIMLCLNAFNALLALTAISGAILTKKYPAIWGVLVILASVLSMLGQQTGIRTKMAAISFFLPRLDKEIIALREDWRDVNYCYEYAETAMKDILTKHENTLSDLSFEYLSGIEPPTIGKWRRNADKYTAYQAENLA
jgi:small basic protein